MTGSEETLPDEAKRRFLALEVDEVSTVDSPANEREFLIAKNKGTTEDNSMGAQQEHQAVSEEPARAVVSAPVPEGTSDAAVAKALEHVSSIVSKVAELTEKAKTPSAGEEKAKEVTKAAETPAEVPAEKPAAAPAEAPAASTEVEKAAAPAVESALEGLAKSVEIMKAASFTPARVAKLKEIQETLKLLIEGVSAPAAEAPVAKAAGETPAAPVVSDDVVKALTEVQKALTEIVETQKSVATRLDTVEKARPASNVAPESTTPVQKASGSIWKGVL